MKIFILLTIITWSMSSISGVTSKQVVSSPEEAAVLVYQAEQAEKVKKYDRDSKKYKLKEVDVDKNSVKDVEIPKLLFLKDCGTYSYTLDSGFTDVTSSTITAVPLSGYLK